MHSKVIYKAVLVVAAYATAMPGYCEIKVVSPEKLSAMVIEKPAPAIVDVRSGYDFMRGHIPGAVNAAYNSIDKAALPKDAALVLYCGNDKCPLSRLAAKTLETNGYKDVSVLDGGFAAWNTKGFAVETSAGIQQAEKTVKTGSLMPGKLRKQLADKSIGILDLRPDKDFKIAHVQGAKNIPLETLESASAAFSKDLEWIVYDAQSERAKAGARMLAQKEFKVKELSGGIQVWAAKKYPMESGEVK